MNKYKKIRFTPNGWKRSRALGGNQKRKKEKNSSVGDQKVALSNFWCRIMQSNKRYKKGLLQQVMVVNAYKQRIVAYSSESPFS